MMEENEKIQKGHWFNVIILLLLIFAMLGLWRAVVVFGEAHLKYLSATEPLEISGIVWVLCFSLGLFLYTISPLILTWILYKRSSYKLCKLLSIIICFAAPWLTIIGVWTLILLRKDAIKMEFNGQVNHKLANKK